MFRRSRLQGHVLSGAGDTASRGRRVAAAAETQSSTNQSVFLLLSSFLPWSSVLPRRNPCRLWVAIVFAFVVNSIFIERLNIISVVAWYAANMAAFEVARHW